MGLSGGEVLGECGDVSGESFMVCEEDAHAREEHLNLRVLDPGLRDEALLDPLELDSSGGRKLGEIVVAEPNTRRSCHRYGSQKDSTVCVSCPRRMVVLSGLQLE